MPASLGSFEATQAKREMPASLGSFEATQAREY